MRKLCRKKEKYKEVTLYDITKDSSNFSTGEKSFLKLYSQYGMVFLRWMESTKTEKTISEFEKYLSCLNDNKNEP